MTIAILFGIFITLVLLPVITAVLLREYNCRYVLSNVAKKIAEAREDEMSLVLPEAINDLEKLDFKYRSYWDSEIDQMVCFVFRRLNSQKVFELVRIFYLNDLKRMLAGNVCQ